MVDTATDPDHLAIPLAYAVNELTQVLVSIHVPLFGVASALAILPLARVADSRAKEHRAVAVDLAIGEGALVPVAVAVVLLSHALLHAVNPLATVVVVGCVP